MAASSAVSAVLLAGLWNPAFVEVPADWVIERETTAEFAIAPGHVGPSLTDGVRLVQDVLLTLPSPRPGAVPHEACAALSFVTFARTNAGEVVVTLDGGRWSESFVVTAAALADWGTEVFCLRIGSGAVFDGRLRVTVEGRGAESLDEAVAPLISTRRDNQRGGLAGPAIVVAPGGAVTSAAGALGLRVLLDRIEVSNNPPKEALLDYFMLQLLPLGLPMVVAILVIILIGLEVVGRLPGAADVSAGQLRGDGEIDTYTVIPAQIVGFCLLAAGALVLLVGLRPAGADRNFVAIDSTGRGVVSEFGLRLVDDGVAGPFPLPLDVPWSDEIRRDALGRRERLCLAVPASVRAGRIEGGPLAGSIEMTIALNSSRPSGNRETVETELVSEPVLLSDIDGERLVGCFAISPGELGGVDKAWLTLRAIGVPDGLGVELGSRTLQGGNSLARRVTSSGDMVVGSGAPNVSWLRETATFRERLFAGIGVSALAAGVATLVGSMLVQATRRRRCRLRSAPGIH